MELIKENYDLETIWNCPMCGNPFYADRVDDTNESGDTLFLDATCPGCGAFLTVQAEVSCVKVWKDDN